MASSNLTHTSSIITAMDSYVFYACLVVTLTQAISILLSELVDGVLRADSRRQQQLLDAHRSKYQNKSLHMGALIIIIFHDLLALVVAIPQKRVELLWILNNARDEIVFTSLVVLHAQYGPPFTPLRNALCIFGLTIFTFFRCYSGYFFTLTNVYGVISLVGWFITVFSAAFSYKEFFKGVLLKKSVWSARDKDIILLIIVGNYSIFTFVLIASMFYNVQICDTNAVYLVLHQLSITFMVVVGSAGDAQLARMKFEQEQEYLLEQKRLFVRYISHEIRTPLNVAVMGMRTHISTSLTFSLSLSLSLFVFCLLVASLNPPLPTHTPSQNSIRLTC